MLLKSITSSPSMQRCASRASRRPLRVRAQETQQQPSTPTPAPDAAKAKEMAELNNLPWVRSEKDRKGSQDAPKDLPFGLYLLFSAFTTIAAVGSIFEYSNKNAIFGVVQPDSILYTPILGFFAVTGLPTAGFLFFKAVSSANALADSMDKQDGV